MSNLINNLVAKIDSCLTVDQQQLRRLLAKMEQDLKQGKTVNSLLEDFERRVSRSLALVEARIKCLPKVSYNSDLPVVDERENIIAAIREHQVVIVAGETGSGKTTQLPKICIELKRGARGLIGHTQPRRIAARSVATRIAEELDTNLGQGVGYQVRFQDRSDKNTYLKLMTDGILLAQIQHDHYLYQYDTLIIDEAHERGLNIDFLLGYLKQLLPKRPDLKLIITSATIDTEKFSRYFSKAPVIQAQGRSYPVEIVYQPAASEKSEKDLEQMQEILKAVDQLCAYGPGDILVFLASEREIRESADYLGKQLGSQLDVLPLFSRLSIKDQDKVFKTGGRRRIILATNVAETSLTVPGIRYVVDAGKARISRYSFRHKVQRLPIEKISRASSNQRKGRCGRLGPGVCVRLYDEDDFDNRPEFTEPEILRTNLASVILRMLSLGLGEIEAFPFIDPPEQKAINDGYKLLFELQAVEGQKKITPLGRLMSSFPLDPRLSRMLIAARDEACVHEVMVISSFLSIQDPRERPFEARQKADEAHKIFQSKGSDFISCFNLWKFYQEQTKALSSTRLRKLCKTNFLSYPRMREWSDLYSQLNSTAKTLKFAINANDAGDDNIHRALLTGLLGLIGLKQDKHEYQGGHNKRFYIMPGSVCFSKPPHWLVAAEIIETTKLYARMVASIDNQWLERIAAHLLKKSSSDPWWSKKQGKAMVYEKATLYGVVVYADRQVAYSPINASHARQIFIEQGLIGGQFDGRVEFLASNLQLLKALENIEDQLRKRGVLIDEQYWYQFYDQNIDKSIVDAKTFHQWVRRLDSDTLSRLTLSQDEIIKQKELIPEKGDYPEFLLVQDNKIKLSYQFRPGIEQDGVVALIPEVLLVQLKSKDFEFLVPGLLEEKIVALIKTLPKKLRKNFVPVPNFAKACLENLVPGFGGLIQQLSVQLKRMTGVHINLTDWAPDKLPDHLRMYFKVISREKKCIAEGTELLSLQKPGQKMQSAKSETVSSDKADTTDIISFGIKVIASVTCWDFGTLEKQINRQQDGINVTVYPSLREINATHVELVECFSKEEAKSLKVDGLCRLFRLVWEKDIKYIAKNIPKKNKLALLYAPLGNVEKFTQNLLRSIVRVALLGKGEQLDTIGDKESFDKAAQEGVSRLVSVANSISDLILEALVIYQTVVNRLASTELKAYRQATEDISQQLRMLFTKTFPNDVSFENLASFPRYLSAINKRLDKISSDPRKDASQQSILDKCSKSVAVACATYGDNPVATESLQQLKWMLQELRVSVFAQELKTAYPISETRIHKHIDKLKQFIQVSC